MKVKPIIVKPCGTAPGITTYGIGDPLNDPLFWIAEGLVAGFGSGLIIGLALIWW